ncbi:TPA: hypothetical protein QCH58_000398 [Enterobacter asburiae]|nr:hypothetical protein [Enterobacter asburiae]
MVNYYDYYHYQLELIKTEYALKEYAVYEDLPRTPSYKNFLFDLVAISKDKKEIIIIEIINKRHGDHYRNRIRMMEELTTHPFLHHYFNVDRDAQILVDFRYIDNRESEQSEINAKIQEKFSDDNIAIILSERIPPLYLNNESTTTNSFIRDWIYIARMIRSMISFHRAQNNHHRNKNSTLDYFNLILYEFDIHPLEQINAEVRDLYTLYSIVLSVIEGNKVSELEAREMRWHLKYLQQQFKIKITSERNK